MDGVIHLDVERDTAADAQILAACLRLEVGEQAQDGFFEEELDFVGEIFVCGGEFLVSKACRKADQFDKGVGVSVGVGVFAVMDVLGIDVEGEAIVLEKNDLAKGFAVGEVGTTEGGKTHDLVLAIVGFKAEILGHGGVEPAERMGDVDRVQAFKLIALSSPDGECV